MKTSDHDSCPHCGEPVAPAAQVCPFCKGSLLVDVVVDSPVSDPRIRYQLAREISSWGPPAPDFSVLLKELRESRPLAARSVTNLAARRLIEMLADIGLAARAEDAGAVQAAGLKSRRFAVAGTLGAAVLLGAILLRAGPEDRGASQPASRPDRRAPAGTGSWPAPSPPLSSRDLSELAGPSTVSVHCGETAISGFFTAPELVLTRIPGGCGVVQVRLADHRQLHGEVREAVQWLGLTQVHVPGAAAEPLQMGDATTLYPGAPVAFLSVTEDGAPVLHESRIGTAAREIHRVAHIPLEGTVALGDIGGPVLDSQGRVVGLVAGEAEGEAFLLPINYAYEGTRLAERPRGADSEKWKTLLAEVKAAEAARLQPSLP